MSRLSDFTAVQAGLRNRIINGGMSISQRGTFFSGITVPASYTVDRWAFTNFTDGVFTITQSADIPANTLNSGIQNSLRLVVGGTESSLAVGQICNFTQPIEGYNIVDLINNTFTISFWVKATTTGTYCIALRNSALDRSYVSEYTISSSNTWEQKFITIQGGIPTTGSWVLNNGTGVTLNFTLAAGSSFHTTANAWQTGNFMSTSAQSNPFTSNGNVFLITAVQLELGAVATPFEQRPYGMELALCQRYYSKSYNQATVPSSITTEGCFSIQRTGSTILDRFGLRFPTAMRTTPSSITVYSTVSGNGGNIYDPTGAIDVAATLINSGETGCTVSWSATAARNYFFQYTASAEL